MNFTWLIPPDNLTHTTTQEAFPVNNQSVVLFPLHSLAFNSSSASCLDLTSSSTSSNKCLIMSNADLIRVCALTENCYLWGLGIFCSIENPISIQDSICHWYIKSFHIFRCIWSDYRLVLWCRLQFRVKPPNRSSLQSFQFFFTWQNCNQSFNNSSMKQSKTPELWNTYYETAYNDYRQAISLKPAVPESWPHFRKRPKQLSHTIVIISKLLRKDLCG